MLSLKNFQQKEKKIMSAYVLKIQGCPHISLRIIL